jgi:hypothetical protein
MLMMNIKKSFGSVLIQATSTGKSVNNKGIKNNNNNNYNFMLHKKKYKLNNFATKIEIHL